MIKEFRLSVEAENLLTKLRDYMQDAELAEGVSRESLRNVRDLLKMADSDRADLEKQLVAAEKRAEEAEARLARLAGVCRHGACGDPPLESGYCREHEAAMSAPTQPQEPTP